MEEQAPHSFRAHLQPHSIYPFAGLYRTYRILLPEILGQMVHFMNLCSGLIRHLKPRHGLRCLDERLREVRSATAADLCGPATWSLPAVLANLIAAFSPPWGGQELLCPVSPMVAAAAPAIVSHGRSWSGRPSLTASAQIGQMAVQSENPDVCCLCDHTNERPTEAWRWGVQRRACGGYARPYDRDRAQREAVILFSIRITVPRVR